MKQHHFEVYVVTEGDKLVPGVDLNGELSATWWDGTVYDDDSGMWGPWDDETSGAASEHLVRWLDFPLRVKRIYEQWTDGDGWDINIMTDIMRELIALGVVDPEAAIAQ